MREILRQLNEKAGAVGSMVITPDGIMVAAVLGERFEEDAMAALASSLLLSLRRCLSTLGAKGSMKSCTLNASDGKVIFLDMSNSYLVVVADQNASLDGDADAIQDAIQEIGSRRIA